MQCLSWTAGFVDRFGRGEELGWLRNRETATSRMLLILIV